MKIAVTVFGLVGLFQFNEAGRFVAFNFANAGHSLSVLKESGADLSARAEQFISVSGGKH